MNVNSKNDKLSIIIKVSQNTLSLLELVESGGVRFEVVMRPDEDVNELKLTSNSKRHKKKSDKENPSRATIELGSRPRKESQQLKAYDFLATHFRNEKIAHMVRKDINDLLFKDMKNSNASSTVSNMLIYGYLRVVPK